MGYLCRAVLAPQPLNMEGLLMVTPPPNTLETTNLLSPQTVLAQVGKLSARVLDQEGHERDGGDVQ